MWLSSAQDLPLTVWLYGVSATRSAAVPRQIKRHSENLRGLGIYSVVDQAGVLCSAWYELSPTKTLPHTLSLARQGL